MRRSERQSCDGEGDVDASRIRSRRWSGCGGLALAVVSRRRCQWSDEQALFQTAIEFERDTILFFEMIQALVGHAKESEALKEIIEEEYRHINLLRRCEGAE